MLTSFQKQCKMSMGSTIHTKCGNQISSSQFLQVYEQIEFLLSKPKPEPVSVTAKLSAIEAYDHLRCHHYINEAEQLVNLLAKPHIKSLLLCHDGIANRAYGPILPEISSEVDEDDVSIKVVNLIKKDEPLGATIKINERNGAVLVARVMHGGAADRSNVIDVGDEIQEINGTTVHGRDPMEVIRMLTTISGDVKLKLIPSASKNQQLDQNQVYVRALFSYSPRSDPLTPCPEAGLAFLKGEILRVVNSEDPNWWQAIKIEFPLNSTMSSALGSSVTQPGLGRAGLIPSKTMREWKIQYHFNGQDTQTSDSLSYEEVERYFPEEGCYRPIVLIGPSGVGKSELVHQLIRTDPEHFREPVRITTREPHLDEVHGVDYLFVTCEEFNTFLEADSLIDPIEISKNHFTGLCLDAVLEIIHSGQVAVFEADYHNINQLRTSSLKPFIIFVKPPSLDVLIETRQLCKSPCSTTSSSILPCSSDRRSSVTDLVVTQNSLPNTPHLTNHTIGCFAHIAPMKNRTNCKNSEDNSLTNRLLSLSSMDNLLLRNTNKKSNISENQLHEMIQTASRLEVTHGHLWDFVLINDDLPFALEQLSELAYRIETEAFWVPRIWITSNETTTITEHYGNINGDNNNNHNSNSNNSCPQHTN